MTPYICEFLGTFMLILLGNSAVAGAVLNHSEMKGAGSVQITFAWGFAVMIPAFIFGGASGAHFNPAVTLAFAIAGRFDWSMVVGYIISQFLGAFFGAVLVWLIYKDQFDRTDNSDQIFGCFATSPAIKHISLNMLSEATATFVLVFSLLGISNVEEIATGLSNVYVCALITGIGMSFGGTTGYAINPARDLGPRLAHQLLPMMNKSTSQWDYAVVPLVGPIIGSVLAALLYIAIF